MQFTFDVDGTTVEFSRNWFTGRCTLHTGSRDEVLQSSLNPFTHYSMKLKRQWHFSVEDHAVIIEKGPHPCCWPDFGHKRIGSSSTANSFWNAAEFRGCTRHKSLLGCSSWRS